MLQEMSQEEPLPQEPEETAQMTQVSLERSSNPRSSSHMWSRMASSLLSLRYKQPQPEFF